MKTVMAIAGFDPSSGAGITADLMVFAAHGLFGTSCITALTVQNTCGVFATQAVTTDTISRTLEYLYQDLPPAGIKIGMLATAEIVSTVADFLLRLPKNLPIVLDPVLKSSSGKDLLEPAGVAVLRERLIPLVSWITPNVAELAALMHRKLNKMSEIEAAAKDLQSHGRELGVIVTRGDADPPLDLLLPPGLPLSFVEGTHIETTATHGTGCAFSSALLSRLVQGDDAASSAAAAKSYVSQSMRLATRLGKGRGPMNLLWPL